jgi:molybdopterin-guanine dinucleotide biosynthesis protein A
VSSDTTDAPGVWTGAVLAGGAGRRLGGGKPLAPLADRALVLHPLAAVAAVCDRVAVVCKPRTRLPPLPRGTQRWDDEPLEPLHPLTGIVHALERARGPVLICAGDMPYVTPDLCRALLAAAGTAGATVALAGGVLVPTFGAYRPEVLPRLRRAPADAPLTRTMEALAPVGVSLPPAALRSVNTWAELRAAEIELAGSERAP